MLAMVVNAIEPLPIGRSLIAVSQLGLLGERVGAAGVGAADPGGPLPQLANLVECGRPDLPRQQLPAYQPSRWCAGACTGQVLGERLDFGCEDQGVVDKTLCVAGQLE